jgi:hypothetical protein
MKKLTTKQANKILRERPARRFIQSVEDGTVEITFDSEIFVTSEGEEDILGFIWEKDWDKVEARVLINGEPRIYSLGGTEFSFMADFISTCNKYGVDIENLEGETFKITKTGDWTQEIQYVGKKSSSGKPLKKEVEVEEDLVEDAINTINDIKENSPDLLKGWKENDLITALSVRGRMRASEARDVLPVLIKKNIISIKDGKVKVN